MDYVAFLRGINSGKNPTVRMEVLREIFRGLGLTRVRTVLASGNVLFAAEGTDEGALARSVHAALPGAIGFESAVFVRTLDDLRRLVASDPFRDANIPPGAARYVTFVASDAPRALPPNGKGYTIIGAFDGILCSIVDLSQTSTPSLMRVLDRTFPGNTTRSWDTIARTLRLATRT